MAVRLKTVYIQYGDSLKQGPAMSQKPPRLLDQLREQIRYRHCSLQTERTYVHWTRAFIRFHHLRHLCERGAVETESYLSYSAEMRCSRYWGQ